MATKIFAKNINHLTDARYFAAWGVSWMCYDPAKISISEIGVIKEWVEGPKHIIDISKIDVSEAVALLSMEAIDGYLTDNPMVHQQIQDENIMEVEAFVYASQPTPRATTVKAINVTDLGDYRETICDISGSSMDIISFVRRNKPYGILLSGGEEEEIGVKSFDDLDMILESLESY